MKAAPQAVILNLALCCALAQAAAAQVSVEPFESREAFAAAAARLSTVDFEADAPARGFKMHRPPEGLVAGGVTFRASGGARFGPGVIYVLSAHYAAPNPMYRTGTGALLSWAAPNQAGSAALDVTLPAGTTAVGAELWTQQPQVSRVVVTATTAEGQTLTAFVNTRARPAGAFVGFISETPIVTLSFRPLAGQTGLLLDNFVYGRKAEGRSVRPPAAEALKKIADEVEALMGQPPAAPDKQTPAAAPPPTPTPAGEPVAGLRERLPL